MNQISGKVSEQEEQKKILYADDLAVVEDSKEELQKTRQEWSNIFRKQQYLEPDRFCLFIATFLPDPFKNYLIVCPMIPPKPKKKCDAIVDTK